MRVLITGGAGFIGSHLTLYHLDRGDEVWVVDNLITSTKNNLQDCFFSKKFLFNEEDILSWKGLKKAIEWADRIYHMASIVGQKAVISNPLEVLKVNVHSLERIFDFLYKSNKKIPVLIPSSSCVYGYENDPSYKEDSILGVLSGEHRQQSYSISKLMNEEMSLIYAREYGLPCIIARLFNVVGPNQISKYGMVVPTFISQAMKGEPITVFGEGKQTRSFCHIKDAIKAMDLLLSKEEIFGEIVNIGHEEEITIYDLAVMIRDITKSSSAIDFISYEKAYGFGWKEIQKRKPDLTKLFQVTKFKPEYSLYQTLEEIIRSKL